jgi:hypothetical protein
MTLITLQDGRLVLRDGQVGTEQACCCGCPCLDFSTGEGFTISQNGPWVVGSPSYYTFGGTCPAGASEFCRYSAGTPANPAFLDDGAQYYFASFNDAGPADTVNSLQVYMQCVSGQWFAQIWYSIYGDFTDCPGGGFFPPQVDLQWYGVPLTLAADCLPTGTLELGAADYVFATDYDGNEIASSGGNAPACFNLTLPDILFGRP